ERRAGRDDVERTNTRRAGIVHSAQARGPSTADERCRQMALRLTPRDDRFYTMFAAAAKNLVTGASLLGEQISAKVDERPDVAARMRDAEHAGDDVTHEIFSTVNGTFVTPFDREDIYQ